MLLCHFQTLHGDIAHALITISQTSEMGIKTFQPRSINWSKRESGKVARAQIKMERSRKTLNASQKTPGINDRNANGASQPPRKSVAVSAEMTIILIYSARKNSANAIPE